MYLCYTLTLVSPRLSLAEVAAAAELIMKQDKEREEEKGDCDSSDEGFGGEESECEEEGVEEMETNTHPGNNSLADSGYGGVDTPPPLESAQSR